ncbi:S8 family serine peptidase [Streptomyces sp. HUAS ZL42]|uniref:S8 family peptidase n=1 Tax=Streptomyces sp. HUAS ZL42 TaxID=3231715 RepID=UPI00345E5C14
MTDRRRTAHVVLTLEPGAGRGHVPAHLDVLVGAARSASTLDGGRIDRTLTGAAGAFRATALFPSRRNVGRVGARGSGYDALEESLGLSRTYRLRLADPAAADAVVERLRELPGVASAARELLATAPGTATGGTTARTAAQPPSQREIEAPHRLVRSAEALAMEPGDERVTVAVVDTGIALGHAEFQRKLLMGYDAVDLGLGRISSTMTLVGDSSGRDFSPSDDVGHGSHVAGVIAAQGWQLPAGTAGRSLLLPVRVLAGALDEGDRGVVGVGAVGDIDAGLKIACDLGADVINMSFGTPATDLDPASPRPHAAVLEYATRHGCVLVAAAGNSGLPDVFYPAADRHVIAVGSVGARGLRSPFSSYGAPITLSAPGENVVSVGRRGYRRSSGTSHAAPFVAGAAALLVARARRRGRPVSAAAVTELLTRSARPSASPAHEVGAGVLDIAGALEAFDSGSYTSAPAAEGERHG